MALARLQERQELRGAALPELRLALQELAVRLPVRMASARLA